MIRRKFIPGSRWLYFKIYTGIKTADEVATRTLLPLLRELYEAKLIDDWFFIRYTDPDFHLRLRLLVARPEHYAAIFARIGSSVEPLVDNGAVVKVVCDTYVREIERYGAGTMEAVERLFGIDSRAVLELLDRVAEEPADRRETVRWQLALLLLDDAMTAFGREPEEKLRLFSNMAGNFKQEFGFTSHPFTRQINDKYRRYRAEIEKGLSVREPFAAYEPVLRRRRAELERVAAEILRIKDEDAAPPSTDELLGSIAHMTMNRWFRTGNRQFELVVYDFLSKYFESSVARTKRAGTEKRMP
ncbi:thiopeptide-type bacteriocin biosynthesis protein [uncultured Alistipes sp.]|uniref:thiopeptide-type bacteriocin biosynthesis protein n=1 Tax=uncultured Alistipes sp. TaxID=538949 RepID=UPI00262B14F4|nr:thiopeptide-type bacteriocin biosynthesis protein [uncultured Alistipes sp.]